MSGHSPTRWKCDPVIPGTYGFQPRISDGDKLIAVVGNAEPAYEVQEEWEANAAFIVRAVNAHDALVAALDKIAHMHWEPDMTDCELAQFAHAIASEALRLAKGETADREAA